MILISDAVVNIEKLLKYTVNNSKRRQVNRFEWRLVEGGQNDQKTDHKNDKKINQLEEEMVSAMKQTFYVNV